MTRTSTEQSTATENLLEQAISATKQTEPEQARELLKNITESALDGTVAWNTNLLKTINNAINDIDAVLSKQLAAIMHHEKFTKLEGTYRGLHYFVHNTRTCATMKIRVLNASKRDISKDLSRAVEYDQSQLFKKIYEAEYGIAGGHPYGALVGDYEFSNHPEDIEFLQRISNVSAAAFCPFLSAASPKLLGLDDWQDLSKPRDIEKIFDSQEYAKWRSFRDSEDSRYVVLTMPRFLSRIPYGKNTKKIEEFDFEELEVDENGQAKQADSSQFCWSNTAYALATRLTDSFDQYGWCTSIRGAENGGKVENLPLYTFKSDDGDLDTQCPAEIGITDRRENELSKMGLLPLCHYKNTDYAVFFGSETTQKAKVYDQDDATANAKISARLSYIMASSRFAHYLKVLARDKIGSFMEASDVEKWLNQWIGQYVNDSENLGAEQKAKKPLKEAKVIVSEVPGSPGAYQATAWLRPWLQMEALTTSLRMVANIPKKTD